MEAVDDEPLLPGLLTAVQKLLYDNGIKDAKSLIGSNEEEIAGLWSGQLGVKAYMRRVVRAANLAEARAEPGSGSLLKEAITLLVGHGEMCSAQAIALALKASSVAVQPKVTILDMLQKAQISLVGMPHYSQADLAIWSSVRLDTQQARREGRYLFTCV